MRLSCWNSTDSSFAAMRVRHVSIDVAPFLGSHAFMKRRIDGRGSPRLVLQLHRCSSINRNRFDRRNQWVPMPPIWTASRRGSSEEVGKICGAAGCRGVAELSRRDCDESILQRHHHPDHAEQAQARAGPNLLPDSGGLAQLAAALARARPGGGLLGMHQSCLP